MAPLTIFILCHNRPDYARQAILSVLNQTSKAFTLIVSDHSSNDEVGRMVRAEFPEICYIRRSSALKHLEHFNLCIEEAQSDYYCLFHDDDLMSPNFVDVMSKCILAYPAAAAYACNAEIETNGKLGPRTSFRSFRKYELIDTPRNLAERYFSRAQSGIAPNPSYIYSRRLAGDQRFLVDGGKYADVTLLLDIVQKGPIIWINKPLMTYRMHESNIGNIESLRDRLRFLGYLKKNRAIFGEGLMKDYRCSFIYKKVLKKHPESHKKRCSVARAFLKAYPFSRYTRLECYRALAVRALVKWVAE
jgi:glycosyltransferase involved in cell wall biosynthesis